MHPLPKSRLAGWWSKPSLLAAYSETRIVSCMTSTECAPSVSAGTTQGSWRDFCPWPNGRVETMKCGLARVSCLIFLFFFYVKNDWCSVVWNKNDAMKCCAWVVSIPQMFWVSPSKNGHGKEVVNIAKFSGLMFRYALSCLRPSWCHTWKMNTLCCGEHTSGFVPHTQQLGKFSLHKWIQGDFKALQCDIFFVTEKWQGVTVTLFSWMVHLGNIAELAEIVNMLQVAAIAGLHLYL